MSTLEAQRRHQILDAAERLLRHYGPHKTTIAEIAREAEVGVGTVYLEFASKEAILEELSNVRHASVLRSMRDAAAARSVRVVERLCGVLDARVEAFLRLADEGVHAPDLIHCMHPGVKSAHERYKSQEQALLADLLREGTRSGEFAPLDADITALVVLHAYATFAPPKIFIQPRDEMRKLLRGMHELVMHGLLARDSTRRGTKRK
jgi:AcrR family transcriptional regulator